MCEEHEVSCVRVFCSAFLKGSSLSWASFLNERKKLNESGCATLSQTRRDGGMMGGRVKGRKKRNYCELRENIFIFFLKLGITSFSRCCYDCLKREGLITVSHGKQNFEVHQWYCMKLSWNFTENLSYLSKSL